MSAKTKVIVLKSKELIYTGIFIVLGILLVLLLCYMFSPKKDKKPEPATSQTLATYQPGVYASNINIGGSTMELQTTIDEHAVTHLEIINPDETVTAMYPLLSPSVDAINSQLALTGSLDDVTYSGDSQYTTIVLLEAARQSAELARITD